MKIILAPNGQGRHEVDLKDVTIPDLWGIQEELRFKLKKPKAADAVLECWHLASDLLWNLHNMETPGHATEEMRKAAFRRLHVS